MEVNKDKGTGVGFTNCNLTGDVNARDYVIPEPNTVCKEHEWVDVPIINNGIITGNAVTCSKCGRLRRGFTETFLAEISEEIKPKDHELINNVIEIVQDYTGSTLIDFQAENIIKLGCRFSEWQLCPKCNGSGNMRHIGEYASTTAFVQCDVCFGAKVLVKPKIDFKIKENLSVISDNEWEDIWREFDKIEGYRFTQIFLKKWLQEKYFAPDKKNV